MKTAEEWNNELEELMNHWIFCECQSLEENKSTVKDFLKRVQLDAWKQGMSDAISLVKEGKDIFKSYPKAGLMVEACENILINLNDKLNNESIGNVSLE